MGNCLVTKLKESVNNDNLDVLGTFKIKVKAQVGEPADGTTLFYITTSKDVTLTATGDGLISKNWHAGQTSVVVDRDQRTLIGVNNKDYEIVVSSKYDTVTSFEMYNNSGSITYGNVDLFKNMNLSTLKLSGFDWTGDISNICDIPALSLVRTGVSGDIGCFAGKTIQGLDNVLYFSFNENMYGNFNALNISSSITRISIPGTKITCNINTLNNFSKESLLVFEGNNNQNTTGEINTLAENINTVRKSGNVRLELLGSGCTWDGNPITNSAIWIVFSQSGYTITPNNPN